MKYDVIIVGGGIAGLTSAAYLSKEGIQVLLIEKGEKTGGLVNTFWRDGFAFDGGIRAFENSGILFPMLKELGISMDVVQSTVRVGIGDQWVSIDSKETLADYGAFLNRIFPGCSSDVEKILSAIKQVMKHMDVLYGIDNPLFLGEKLKEPSYLIKTLLPWLIRYQYHIRKAGRLNQPVAQYLKRFTSNQALIDMICQHFFTDTPTFFALSYFGLYLDYSYPKGGTGALADKMTQYIVEHGGVIDLKETVVELHPSEWRIKTSNGISYEYEQLIWAADQKSLYRSLWKENPSISWEKHQRIVEKSIGGDSILSFYLELEETTDYFKDRCGAHGFYTPKAQGLSSLTGWENVDDSDVKKIYEWIDDYLEYTTYELSCPVLRDETLAPRGKVGLIVSTLFDYHLVALLKEKGEYESFKIHAMNKVLQVLDESAFPGIAKSLMYGECATPLSMENRYGNAHGAITGWSFTNDPIPSVHSFRHIAKSVKTPIQHIYQCGQWTFSPSGLPISILTGKLASDEVSKERSR